MKTGEQPWLPLQTSLEAEDAVGVLTNRRGHLSHLLLPPTAKGPLRSTVFVYGASHGCRGLFERRY